MFYVTGDIHGDPRSLIKKIKRYGLTENDTIIIVGDCGFNYFRNYRDKVAKDLTEKVPCKWFCIQGNHEGRPHNYPEYHLTDFCSGKVWVEDEYPNILFAKDGEVYDFDGKRCLVIGGAYSVDKFYRVVHRVMIDGSVDSETYHRWVKYVGKQDDSKVKEEIENFIANKPYGWGGWFSDEQISDEDMKHVEEKINTKIDFILSHTCPHRHEPVEMFLSQVNQSAVDKRMETWLDTIEDNALFEKWYCGHWHTDKTDGKLRFLYEDLIELGK